ncbi:hypothetical protein E4T56_gene18174 [Termitomyces sp. T112]|nr:hypothetical protein E4T56_gene18174 [Termitomyces sp. T112]
MEASPSMSFPAILRNPGLSGRFAHLQVNALPLPGAPTSTKKLKREHEGKRWIRRKENERFMGNPHIVTASKRDYAIPIPHTRATFPEPLPPHLPRSIRLPSTVIPDSDPNSANAGRFSLSLKGMRRELRRSGFRAELLVRDVEYEIVEWLREGGIVLNPDSHGTDDLAATGIPIGNTGIIFEVSRTPLQLVWSTDDDSFARYVVHCCARYHEVVSFSKEISGRRLTYLLRPNVTRPDQYAIAAIVTPPVTDLDYTSYADTESDRGGFETDSETEQLPSGETSHLPVITEGPPSPRLPRRLDEGQWSVVGETDLEGDESGSDAELITNIGPLDPRPTDSNNTASKSDDLYLRQSYLRQRALRRRSSQDSTDSSPSRSPVKRPFRRVPLGEQPRLPRPLFHQQHSFYDYLFS